MDEKLSVIQEGCIQRLFSRWKKQILPRNFDSQSLQGEMKISFPIPFFYVAVVH